MSVRLMSEVFKHVHGMPSGRRMLLLVLADFANDEGVCWPSIKSLATNADLGERHVSGELKALAHEGFITIEEVAGKSNHYRVNSPKGMNPSSGVKPSEGVNPTAPLNPSSPRTTVQGGDEPQFTTGGEPQATPPLNHSSPPLRLTPIEPPVEPPSEPSERARAKKATQVPDVFAVSDDLYGWAWSELEMQRAEVDRETAKMLDHFRANGGTKKDWLATWRNWMRRSHEFRRPAHTNGKEPTMTNAELSRAAIRRAAGQVPEPIGPVYETTGRIRS